MSATPAMSTISSVGLVGDFEERGPGVGTHGGAPGVEVGSFDQGGFDAEARQQLLDDIETRAEQGSCGHDMVARLQLAHQGRGDRRHAACRGARRLRAFQERHAPLEHGDGRVGEARIDEPRILALEPRLRHLHRVVEIALREEQRLRGLLEAGAQRPAVNELGRGAQALGVAGFAGIGHLLFVLSGSAPEGKKTRRISEGPDLLARCLTWRQADRLK